MKRRRDDSSATISMSIAESKNKRPRKVCQHVSENDERCTTPVKFLKGGIVNRCSKHGGVVRKLCQHISEDGIGCTTPVNFKEGGIANRCKKHGGFPPCQHISEDGTKCTTPVLFMVGGIANRCIKHGGFPPCQHISENDERCATPVKFVKGGQVDRCSKHGGVVRKLCQHISEDGIGCTTPVNFKEGGQVNRCQKHGGIPLCQHMSEDGTKCVTPVNFKEGGIANRCSKHGGIPLCQHISEDDIKCTTPACFRVGGKVDRCSKHGGFPLCQYISEDGIGCTTPVKFIEGGIVDRCQKHGGYPPCDEEGCDTSVHYITGGIRGKCCKHGGHPFCVCRVFTVTKLGGLCCLCDPNSKTTRLQKEMKVRAYLAESFPDVKFEYGKRIYQQSGSVCDMSKAFYAPDILVITAWGHLIIEVDEKQHEAYKLNHGGQGYSCDNRRMVEIWELLGVRVASVVFIRYNPDAFKINSVTTRIPTDVRLKTLKKFVGDYITGIRVPQSPLECVYLYYNCDCNGSRGSSDSIGNSIDDVTTVGSIGSSIDRDTVDKCVGVHYGMKL